METPYTMSDVAGSAYMAARQPDGSPYDSWEQWYRWHQTTDAKDSTPWDLHQATLSAGPVAFCKVSGVEAAFGMDDVRALSGWLKSNRAPKARKARGESDAARLRSLAAKVRALIQEIERRDGEGNVIPDYLYAPIKREVCHA